MEELIPIALFVSAAAVMILRPLTTRLGNLFDAIARDRTKAASGDADLASVRISLEHLNKRLDLIEERLDFTERLVAGSRRPTALSDHAIRDRPNL